MMEFATTNEPGRCALSGKDTHYIKSSWPGGHIFAGRPREIGPPLPCCFDVSLILLSGSIARVSIHEDHINDVVENIAILWRNILQSEDDTIKIAAAASVSNPYNEVQLQQYKRHRIELTHNLPLGVYAIERILDRAQREKAARSH